MSLTNRMLTLPSQVRSVVILFALSHFGLGTAQMDPDPTANSAASSVVTFNEVMFHPADGVAGTEWLELHNQMSVDLDISHWRLTGGIDFQFPSNTVFAANSYLVVAGDPNRLRGGAGLAHVFGPFTGRLSGSDTVRLRNQNGRLLDELSYLDHDPWPVGADGSGASLSKRHRFDSSRPAVNWRASAQAGGTPGKENFPETASPPPEPVQLFATGAGARWLVPQDDSFGEAWTLPTFDDSSWSEGTASVGYDTNADGPTELANVALHKPVIDGSGAYANNPFDVPDGAGSFIAQNVTDGSTTDQFGVNYWLGREGRVNEYFTLDLGGSVQIQEIHLRNTHNTTYNDRGTARFQIHSSQSIDAGRQLVQPTLILSGTLTKVSGLSPIPADVFTSANGLVVTHARYLRFTALTADNAGNNVGLNEIEVYAPVIAGPARAYSFEGNVNDVSGHGFNGQNAGGEFSIVVPPQVAGNYSLILSGDAKQVIVPDPVSPSAYTIALWVNVDALRPSSLILRTDAAGPLSSWSHQLRLNESGHFEHYLFDGAGHVVVATNTIMPGVWYHVAITAASHGAMQIYVNGVASGGTEPVGSLWSGGDQWRLGSNAGNAARFYAGRMDEIGIWHTVLSSETIRRLAGGQSPVQPGGYSVLFETDLLSTLYQKNSSLWLRIPFQNPSAAGYDQLVLQARYADGFVAFLNGTEVLRRNAPQPLSWNSTATVDRPHTDGLNLETFDLSPFLPSLVVGTNVLAVQALRSSSTDSSFLFAAELSARLATANAVTNVAFSEIAGSGSVPFFVELLNFGPAPISLLNCTLLSSNGARRQLGSNVLAPGALLTLTAQELDLPRREGDRLFLLGPDGGLIDAVEIQRRARARLTATPGAPWCYPSRETPGQANEFLFHREIVINEIMYHHAPVYRTRSTPFAENTEQWIELCNISSHVVDLGAWQLAGAVSFNFPPGTTLAPDSYLVIANDPAALRARDRGIVVLGPFEGRLSHHDAHVILRDENGNVANEVHYWNRHPWPAYANGGGSSLELRDPRADNSAAEAWGASLEGTQAPWRHYSYRAVAIKPVYSPEIFSFHEFRMGLLDEGEALIDNITVTEMTSPPRQLLQNTDFSSGTARWRLLGNHSHSEVEPSPGDPVNRVLHLVATGNTSYLDNRLETTLKSGTALAPVVAGREYEIAFDAKWLAGSPQLRTELYYNKVAATTILEMPATSGTPGRRNSVYTPNAGPTYAGLTHAPVIPKATDPINVTIQATDPDGLASLALWYSVNDGGWIRAPMTASGHEADRFVAVLPAQPNGAVIQFYIEGTDSLGAVSTYPAAGRSSRALIKVDSPRLTATKQTFRTIMTPADSALLHSAINMMSDDLLGCTVVHQEREVFYDARIRLHGSMFSRNSPSTTGFTVKFPAGHGWRGGRESVVVRRGALVENFIKHILNSAGGLPGNYDDVVYLVSHRSDNQGTARVILANYDDTFVDSQFENDNDGTVFKLEGIREYLETQNGSPEGLKVSQPIGWVQSFDITNLGDDPEQYRWSIMIQNQRRRDDYSRIVAMGKAFSLTGAALKQAASDTIDVDEWARLFALQSLLGIADIYGVENPHNFAFYVRPSDGRVVGLQNDWQFAFALPSNASIYGSKNVYKVLRLPGFQRVYQGHLLDLIDSVVNSAYLTPWARHYSTVTGEGYTGYPAYVAARGTAVRSQLAAKVPFEIQSNNGIDFTVDTPTVTLGGRGWIDVYQVYRTGQATPVPLVWLDNEHWQATLPLASGTNRIELRAFNFRGVQVGQDSIAVATTVTEFPQREFLRITEVMYHPRPPSLAEASAGFTDPDDFEFVELLNTGPATLSLGGVRFTAGITFDFDRGNLTHLLPSERVLVVKNQAAFSFRYGTNLAVAGEYSGSLSNAGELLRLVDSSGATIHEWMFSDQAPWPEAADGDGYSLEALDLNGDYNDPANWTASALLDGTPGSPGAGQLAFAAITCDGREVRLFFPAAPGQAYTLYRSDTLAPGSWLPLQQIPPSNQRQVQEVLLSPSAPRQFFRISSP